MDSNSSLNIGKIGELSVAEYYKMQGYDIVAQNWRWSNKGEIDIITLNRKSNTLVICEVKTRKSDSVVRGREAVNYKKQQKLRRLATVFLQKNTIYSECDIRFDVADVIADVESLKISKIDLIENAF